MRGRRAVVAGAVVVAATLVASMAWADAGDLDPTFGSGGIAHMSVVESTSTRGAATAVQPDSKVVIVANSGSNFAVLRMNADGSPDASFGTDGVVTTSFAVPQSASAASGVAIQPDGKIVVVGTTWSYTSLGVRGSYFSVARYLPDGRLDPSFGARGTVLTAFARHDVSDAHAVALQPDGAIVVAGSVDFDRALALARYTPNGFPDTTFGSAGTVVDSTLMSATSVAVRRDGRIVVGGSSIGSGAMLARFQPGGTRDATFGVAGAVSVPRRSIAALALDAAEQIVTAGSSYDAPGFVVERFLGDGSPDTSFGTGGSTTTFVGCGYETIARGLAIEPDGTIVLAGAGCADAFALVRYRADGRVDGRFGQDGVVTTDADQVNGALAVAAAPDGRIVAVGYYGYRFTAVRYLAR